VRRKQGGTCEVGEGWGDYMVLVERTFAKPPILRDSWILSCSMVLVAFNYAKLTNYGSEFKNRNV
jgi:hypothetical protein